MSEFTRTLVTVLVAGGLAGAAWFAAPGSTTPPVFDDQGQPFFPPLDDVVGTPGDPAITSLEVIEYDDATASALPFKVEFADGLWTIPSHAGYPADAADRLAKTAAGVLGLRKDRIVSDRARDHEALGVVDPLASDGEALTGRGTRVTLRGRNGAVVADFIVGRPVEGAVDMAYVRLPDRTRTYAVRIDADLSARFADWIETDLLRLAADDVVGIDLDNYSVDESTGTIEEGQLLRLRRSGPDADWSLEGLSTGEEVKAVRVGEIVRALDDLRIVGVRRKPEGLGRSLRTDGGLRMDRAAVASLQSKGFFLTRDGQLVSNEGDLVVTLADGVVLTLRFGEVLYGSGEALTAGAGEEPGSREGEDAPAGATESRYLFVTARFDETTTTAPEAPAEDADEAARAEHEAALERHAERLEEGRERVRALNDRFADWYYVISADLFRQLRADRAALVVPPPPDEGTEDGAVEED